MRIVLPGMGASSAMYQGPWLDLDDTRFLDWPGHLNSYTLNDLADWCCSEYPTATIAIGSSLGGMVALLVASRMKMPDVVLIGSAVSYSEVSSFLRTLQPLGKFLPYEFLSRIAASAPSFLTSGFLEPNPDLVRHSIADLPNFLWQDDAVRVHRIHGTHDHVIECPDNVDLALDGGHLIAISHPHECCRYLLEHGL